MIPELGHFAAVFALACSVAIVGIGFIGAHQLRTNWVEATCSLAKVQFVALFASFALLVICFLQDDFSVLYVANNSNTALPWHYKLVAVLGDHEGSFLFWILVTAIWTLVVALRGKRLPIELHGYVLATLGALNLMFLLFLLGTSNPFLRLVPNVPAEGADLNVILQDVGLLVHPPFLYVGYVGFAVAFAFAVAALMTGKVDSAWARWTRPYTNIAWVFLTVGIALGSWWAYYELGWGGWWMWDPVENASFMPWIVGTALIHSLAATEKRGAFKNWTVLLALMTFSLSLVGAFLVRSGVLTSVHAFAVDPQRGFVLLAILCVTTGSALVLYALRASTIRSRVQYWGISRELLLLINNALLVLAVSTVLIGTLYPLGYEWFMDGEKMSVGPPYFNSVFIPIMLVLAFFLAIAPVSRWKNTPMKLVKHSLLLLAGSVVVALGTSLVLADALSVSVLCASALGIWIVVSHVQSIYRQRNSLTFGYLGMSVAHMGFAVTIIGVAVTSVYSDSRDVRLATGDSIELNERTYEFVSVERVRGPNYVSDQGRFLVDGIELKPERRQYLTRPTITTEAAISPGFTRDLFLSMGEPLDNGTWGVRVQEKPLVRWIWLGALIMGIAGITAAMDKRYRRLAARDPRTLGVAASS